MNWVFLLGCIPARIFLIYLGATLDENVLPYFGLLLLTMSLGFLTLYFTNGRLNAPEAGGKTWWSNLRLIHGFLYLAAAIYALQKTNLVSIPLSIDVLFGLFAYFFIKKQN
jgi:hypothetical protein